MKIRTSLKPLVIMTAAMLPVAAWPATATTTMAVSATVLSSCIVVASPLVFGNYDPTSATAKDATTTIAVTCTSGTAYNVGLDAGGASGATVTTRKLVNGANLLPYAIYKEVGRTNNWGDTTTDRVSGTGNGALQSLTVYGSIPAGAAVPAGAYTDTVNVTVTY